MNSRERVIGIVGAGVVGPALGRRLREAGYRIGSVASRRLDSALDAVNFIGGGHAGDLEDAAAADVVLVTTPDRAITEVAEALSRAPRLWPGACVIHASGALSSEALAPVRRRGARPASMHPLQSFARREDAVSQIPGSYFFCEGEGLDVAMELATAAGGIAVRMGTEGKTLYHAGAAILSNGLVALAESAVSLFERAGIGREEALHALLPLARGTASNLDRVGLPRALTGPVARGDVETVKRHVDAIAREAPDVLPIYRALSLSMIELGIAKGTLDATSAEALRRVLSGDGRA